VPGRAGCITQDRCRRAGGDADAGEGAWRGCTGRYRLGNPKVIHAIFAGHRQRAARCRQCPGCEFALSRMVWLSDRASDFDICCCGKSESPGPAAMASFHERGIRDTGQGVNHAFRHLRHVGTDKPLPGARAATASIKTRRRSKLGGPATPQLS